MEVLRCLVFSFWIVAGLQVTLAFVNQRSLQQSRRIYCQPTNTEMHMSLDNFKDDIDISSSENDSQPPSSTHEEESSPMGSFSTQQRPNRIEQINNIQGVWWTSERKDQLVEIRSSYAIFDVMQNTYVSSTSPMPPAVAWPLGGTDDIVTLRTFKLSLPSLSHYGDWIPEWIASPTSKVSVQRGGGTAIGIESPSVQTVSPTPTTSLTWIRCDNPDECWRSDRVVQGYEERSLTTLECSEGPHWSASPVDILRACMKGVMSGDYSRDGDDLVNCLCRFSELPEAVAAVAASGAVNIGRKHSNQEALLSIAEQFKRCRGSTTQPQWSIVKCHYFSPDVCTLRVDIRSIADDENVNETKSFEFCLSRETKKPGRATAEDSESSSGTNRSKAPAMHLFNSIMDVELLVSGKTWAIDHIHACSC
mmetsp:Transcript_14307/g.33307  ORF Transcript_14307/g.33307 Transcript_14307/m.33307 type:complete len:420 (-) Transcript_14307:176-1435(-)|eukprot:CAMPEP_0197181032 /NCGR_PEP_ID=MMETSP1423-20130617/5438_1 /TAXON_ID=476441 /ORGANISM="Pseudo-nitzschia heimii, Strain UNC1101" /LENGTH=419 /DNA_ID=CAMNT_0042631195 /DNA_START=63 /DNA_END=1322 /DNA_ORIENTATION=-